MRLTGDELALLQGHREQAHSHLLSGYIRFGSADESADQRCSTGATEVRFLKVSGLVDIRERRCNTVAGKSRLASGRFLDGAASGRLMAHAAVSMQLDERAKVVSSGAEP
jgi:hypothetical protein